MRSSHPAASLHRVLSQSSGMVPGGLEVREEGERAGCESGGAAGARLRMSSNDRGGADQRGTLLPGSQQHMWAGCRCRRPLAAVHQGGALHACRTNLPAMQASRRLHKLLPLLAGRGGAPAAGCDGFLAQPIPATGARALSSRYDHAHADADRPAEGRRHRDDGGERRRGGGGGGRGGRRFPRTFGDAPIDTPRTLQDYQSLVLGLARRRRCVALSPPAAGCDHCCYVPQDLLCRTAAMHAGCLLPHLPCAPRAAPT